MNAVDKEDKASISETYNLGVNLDDVRKLELRYSRRAPGQADLFVEYVGGRLKAFEVDRFWIERLLDHPEERKTPAGPID